MAKIESPGRYAATVTAAEFGESSKGTPFLNLWLNTEQGSIGAWLYLSEKALPSTVKTLRDAFGFDGNFETAVDQVKGKPCSITVEPDEQDPDRMRVKWVNGPSSAKPIENQGDFLKGLSAKAARLPKEAPKAAATPRPAAAPARPAPAAAAAPAKTEDPF